MSGAIEKLQKELKDTQRALAESEERHLRREAEQIKETCRQIEQAHQEWIAALDVVDDPIFMHDKDFRILRCNIAYQKLAELPFNQIIGHPYFEIFPKSDSPLPHCMKTMGDVRSSRSEDDIQIDGSSFRSRAYSLTDEQGQYLYSVHLLENITERKRIQLALRESEEKFHSITASAQDAILMMDDQGNISYCNNAAEKMFGYSAKEAIGQSLHTLIAPARFLEAHKIGFSHFKKTGEGPAIGKTLELAALKKNGTEFPIELSLSAVRIEGRLNAIGIIRDITERKHAETALKRANRALKTLSAGNLALVRAKDENALLKDITDIIVKNGGYMHAAVGYAENDSEQTIIPMSWTDMHEHTFWLQRATWADNEQGQFPVARAIRSGQTQICRNITDESEFTTWRDAVLSRGYASNIALPLIEGDKAFGALSIYSSDTNAFDEEEVRLLEELANDLGYGILNLRTHTLHEQQAMLLRQSLEQSIQTIASTVEARDPYTAGHQNRVSELATAIAREMDLSEEQIHGIHLAAIIHDLGKIHIPAEILSKPGKLNAIEFMLIQTHPQEGYNILKDVKFPWPIADIILQHHEKLDGSGYPQGLKDEEILIEAKIICVADVVEAMSSHRPYRASLGIKPALDEIKHGRGNWYDPLVVDTCVKLFAEKRFAFSVAV